MRVAIAAGGTGGHVNPAIALARELSDDEVSLFGTVGGQEMRLVDAAGFEPVAVDVKGFDRARPLSLPSAGLRALRAMPAVRRQLVERQIEVCVGMGGYVSLPVCYAARLLGIPIVVHEQNIVLGLANRATKPVANAVAVSFEQSLAGAGPNAVVTGNPVLPEIAVVDEPAERQRAWDRFDLDPTRRTLLVFGGSQGARRINDAAVGLASSWAENLHLQVLHVAGPTDAVRIDAEARGRLGDGPLIYRVVDYIDRMVEAYAAADLAVCRGGATTVAELCAVGLPSVIVPYPHHRDRQQERHATVLEAAGASVCLPDSEATTKSLQATVERLWSDDFTVTQMKKAALSLGRPDAARRVAELVRQQAP